MNQRDSSGLPLRAMVMVLLFLGVVFLLVALQYLGPDDDDDGDSAVVSTTTSSATSSADPPRSRSRPRPTSGCSTSPRSPAPPRAPPPGCAMPSWNVTETGNLVLEGVPVTTVYFGEAPGEREAAEDVGRLLEAPVEPQTPRTGGATTGRHRGGHRLGSRTCRSQPSIRLLAAAAVIVPIAAACAPNEPVATEPGTTPPVWTGSPSPTPSGEAGHGGGHGSGAGATSGETLTANLATAGRHRGGHRRRSSSPTASRP